MVTVKRERDFEGAGGGESDDDAVEFDEEEAQEERDAMYDRHKQKRADLKKACQLTEERLMKELEEEQERERRDLDKRQQEARQKCSMTMSKKRRVEAGPSSEGGEDESAVPGWLKESLLRNYKEKMDHREI